MDGPRDDHSKSVKHRKTKIIGYLCIPLDVESKT